MTMGKFFKDAGENLERLVNESTPSVWDALTKKESVLESIAGRLESEITAWTLGKKFTGKEISDIYKVLEFIRKEIK